LIKKDCQLISYCINVISVINVSDGYLTFNIPSTKEQGDEFPAMIRSFFLWAMGVAFVGPTYLAQPSLADSTDRPWYVGVNMAGAEFGKRRFPGRINKDYVYPRRSDLDHFLDQGFNTFRLPFRWERLQRKLGGKFHPRELSRIDKVITHVTGRGAHLILDPHNYAKYFGKRIGSKEVPVTVFAAFWGRLANRYKDNPGVIFGLMNEPYKIRADRWRRDRRK